MFIVYLIYQITADKSYYEGFLEKCAWSQLIPDNSHDTFLTGKLPQYNVTVTEDRITRLRNLSKLYTYKIYMILSGGYYMTEVQPGLQLIVLNTNMYFTLDKLTAGEKDPAGQLQWLEKVLAKTRKSQHKVRNDFIAIV